jgi:hypothetical protein
MLSNRTLRGVAALVSRPWPNSPYSPVPQVYTCPCFVSAAENVLPHTTEQTYNEDENKSKKTIVQETLQSEIFHPIQLYKNTTIEYNASIIFCKKKEITEFPRYSQLNIIAS